MDAISLLDAFDLPAAPRLAIVGAGGKTSLLFRLAHALPGPVVVSNSAHLAVEQGRYAGRVITVNGPKDLPASAAAFEPGVTLFTGPADERGRTRGLPEDLLAALDTLAGERPLLIEADGARGQPLKAPAPWEPPIPSIAGQVAVVAGLSGLGRPLEQAWVYRPDDFAALAGLQPGETIDVPHLARVLNHPVGGLKNVPARAQRIAVLNQADTAPAEQAEELACRLLAGYPRVVIVRLHGAETGVPRVQAVYRRTAGILLAAGESRRMGRPKQLLDWRGEPLVRRQARLALEAGLAPVVVVTGAEAGAVAAALADLAVYVVHNSAWTEGQSGSVRSGLAALPAEIGAAVFLLADQPFVSVELLRALARHHAHSLASIVAPWVRGQRSNPVLFDQHTFADLASLQGDAGGRQVMGKWGVQPLDWPDERLLWDLDRPEDYRRALGAD
jgi:molybdenum cofactor cytidylyltransferase